MKLVLTPNIIARMTTEQRTEMGLAPVAYPSGPTTITVFIHPVGKPRMTRRDKWAKRPAVMRYRSFCDALRAAVPPDWLTRTPCRLVWTAYFAMPKSWSVGTKKRMAGKYHFSKPDRDNVDKAICDALWPRDEMIAEGSQCEQWDDGMGERIIISVEWPREQV